MTQQEARAELESFKTTCYLADAASKELERFRHDNSILCSASDKQRVDGGHAVRSKVEDMAIKHADLTLKLTDLINKRGELLLHISNNISRLKHTHAQLLTIKYLYGVLEYFKFDKGSLEYLAIGTNYSYDWVRELHPAAIREYAEKGLVFNG